MSAYLLDRILSAQERTAVKTLKKLLQNIVDNPGAEKYLKVPLTNKKIKEKLLAVPASKEYLQIIGFEEKGKMLVMPPSSLDVDRLRAELVRIEQSLGGERASPQKSSSAIKPPEIKGVPNDVPEGAIRYYDQAQLLKNHPESKGGGDTTLILSTNREKQTLAEHLLPADQEGETSMKEIEEPAADGATNTTGAPLTPMSESWAKEAEERAMKEEEVQAEQKVKNQAKREGEEQARKEAEEQARKEAEEQAKKEAEEDAARLQTAKNKRADIQNRQDSAREAHAAAQEKEAHASAQEKEAHAAAQEKEAHAAAQEKEAQAAAQGNTAAKVADRLAAANGSVGALDAICTTSTTADAVMALETLHVLLKNIQTEPGVEKYKRIRLYNKNIKRRLCPAPASIEYLEGVGFARRVQKYPDGDMIELLLGGDIDGDLLQSELQQIQMRLQQIRSQ
jgi:hypothetical protein